MLLKMKRSFLLLSSDFHFYVGSFYNQQAILRENTFMKSKRAAEKEAAKKKADDMAMDTSSDARVIDVLAQRLKQHGLMNEESLKIF